MPVPAFWSVGSPVRITGDPSMVSVREPPTALAIPVMGRSGARAPPPRPPLDTVGKGMRLRVSQIGASRMKVLSEPWTSAVAYPVFSKRAFLAAPGAT